MPERATVERAKKKLREGKSPTTAAGELVREEIRHVREGKHGARSPQQAIAIGLSKARRAGVPLKPPRRGRTSRRTRAAARRDYATGQHRRKPRTPSRRRALLARRRATERALRREPRSAASHRALSTQARSAARRRTEKERSAASRKAARTKGRAVRHQAARKAAQTRRRRRSR